MNRNFRILYSLYEIKNVHVLLPSFFISVSENVMFHLQKQKLQRDTNLERKRYDILAASEKIIYIDIG